MGFRDAVMTGMARDGGLLLPEDIPDVRSRLAQWRGLSYTELAVEIFALFGDLPRADLERLVKRSYATFRHPEVTPVVPVGGVHILELFHGPTLAFKDVALQFLGNLFEYVLQDSRDELNIVGATSGDTGSAAIHGVRGRERIRIFIMHPHNRVSPVQEWQMTSVLDPNVFNIAVEGTFDDCQRILRTLFGDLDFKDRLRLGSINSINWARVLAQIVYYFYAAFRVMDATGAGRVRFSVPTGNFGDIFAGYLATKMGLPVSKLILPTNENDILARFFNTGEYRMGEVCETLSDAIFRYL
jgi:threonine synthase